MNHTEKKAKIIRETVLTIIEYSRKENMIIMKRDNHDEYVEHFKSLFTEFSTVQPALFNMCIEGDNLDNLDLILSGLIDRSRGVLSHDEMEKKIGMGIMNNIMDRNGI